MLKLIGNSNAKAYLSNHCSSSFFGSLSSFGAARLALLCELTLPVSLHVLEAGDGGGGMSKRSAVSLLFPLALGLGTLLVVPLLEAIVKVFRGRLVSICCAILNKTTYLCHPSQLNLSNRLMLNCSAEWNLQYLMMKSR